MEIQKFLEEKNIIPVSELTSLATDRRSFGDDVISAFARQIELRSTAAQAILTAAEQANRDSLLASEQRSYDSAIRERDSILSLQRQVEARTEQRNFVPHTQTVKSTATDVELSPVLTPEQRCVDYLEKRGGARYAGEPGALRFGTVIRAFVTGNRDGLSDLERRALSEGSDAAGGFVTPEILGAQFIDRVRNAMVVMRAGAVLVPMTSDTLYLARLAQPGAYGAGSPVTAGAQWKLENNLISESNMTLERVTFNAHTLPMLMRLSVELSEDSSNIDAIIEKEMSAAMALELDRVALKGSGSAPEPRGIKNQSGVLTTAGVGAATDWTFLLSALGLLWGRNFEPNAAIWDATIATKIAKFKSTADAQPLRLPEALTGVRQLRSNQMTSGEVFVGDFTQLLIGMRTSFRLEVSREGGDAFQRLQLMVRAYLRADVQLAHPEAFQILTGVS